MLRNVALEQVKTPFVFLSDIDFLPMPGLYSYLKKQVTTFELNLTNKVKQPVFYISFIGGLFVFVSKK